MKLSADYDKLQDPIVLNDSQRAAIGQIVRTEGFACLFRMQRDEVRKFTDAALSADIANKDQALAALAKAKVAAQLFQGWVNRLNDELAVLDSQNSSIGTADNPENNMAVEEFGGEI